MEDNHNIVAEGFSFTNLADAQLASQERKKIEYLEAHMDYDFPEDIYTVYEKAVKEGIFKTPVGIAYLMHLQSYLMEQPGIDNSSIPPISIHAVYGTKAPEAPVSEAVPSHGSGVAIDLDPANGSDAGTDLDPANGSDAGTDSDPATAPDDGDAPDATIDPDSEEVIARRAAYANKRRLAAKKGKDIKSRLFISIVLNVALFIAVLAMFWIAQNSNVPNILNYERALKNRYASWEQDLAERERVVKEKERAVKEKERELEIGE